MRQERIYLGVLLVVALLASIPQIAVDAQIWGAILAIVGIVAGVLANYDVVQRILIYVVAVALPVFDDCLDAVWVVGPWVDTLLDHVATGIQGYAVGLFVVALIGRLRGAQAATT